VQLPRSPLSTVALFFLRVFAGTLEADALSRVHRAAHFFL